MEFGCTQSLKLVDVWSFLWNSPFFLYIHTTFAVFPNRFETRLLPSKRLHVFLGGRHFVFGVRADGLAASYLPQPHFSHFKSAASTEIGHHEKKHDVGGVVNGNVRRFHILTTRQENAQKTHLKRKRTRSIS